MALWVRPKVNPGPRDRVRVRARLCPIWEVGLIQCQMVFQVAKKWNMLIRDRFFCNYFQKMKSKLQPIIWWVKFLREINEFYLGTKISSSWCRPNLLLFVVWRKKIIFISWHEWVDFLREINSFYFVTKISSNWCKQSFVWFDKKNNFIPFRSVKSWQFFCLCTLILREINFGKFRFSELLFWQLYSL